MIICPSINLLFNDQVSSKNIINSLACKFWCCNSLQLKPVLLLIYTNCRVLTILLCCWPSEHSYRIHIPQNVPIIANLNIRLVITGLYSKFFCPNIFQFMDSSIIRLFLDILSSGAKYYSTKSNLFCWPSDNIFSKMPSWIAFSNNLHKPAMHQITN